MKFYGNIDLLNNEMQQMVIQTETNFPSVPKVGRIVFKDKRIYICIEISAGIPAWVPLTNEIDTYIHQQGAASAAWTISHKLNTTTPLIQIYDENYSMVIPDSVTIIDNNTSLVTLAVAVTGRAVVMLGSTDGAARSKYSYEHTQSVSAAEWVIPHGLGYYPIVRIFVTVDSEIVEMQPFNIVHDSLFQTTVTFSSNRIGTAKLV